ncbi:MAG: DegT/DnrJ/EryC1/StrS family aminotransferase, partial [Paludibacter sp.]
DEIQAAVLNVKLKYLNADLNRRKEVARYYIEHIKHPDIVLPSVKDWDAHVFHLFTIRTTRRDEIQQYLTENGVETLIHYPVPPHKQLAYKKWNNLCLPVTERIHTEELSLPISPVITDYEVIKVIEFINSFPIK